MVLLRDRADKPDVLGERRLVGVAHLGVHLEADRDPGVAEDLVERGQRLTAPVAMP
jgi:hypothetical protein